jgi:hypothetical protein
VRSDFGASCSSPLPACTYQLHPVRERSVAMAVVLSAWVKREAEFYLYCCCRVPLYAANRGACGIELGWLLFDPMVTDQAAAANVQCVQRVARTRVSLLTLPCYCGSCAELSRSASLIADARAALGRGTDRRASRVGEGGPLQLRPCASTFPRGTLQRFRTFVSLPCPSPDSGPRAA